MVQQENLKKLGREKTKEALDKEQDDLDELNADPKKI